MGKHAFLCDACCPTAMLFTDRMVDMSRKLGTLRAAAARDSSRLAELEALLVDAEKLARSFDAILCKQCRKLGPSLPRVGQWPF